MRGIKLVSDAAHSGYGMAGRAYLRALRQSGVPVTWTPMVFGTDWGSWQQPLGTRESPDPEFADVCNAPIDYDTVIVYTYPQYFPKWRAEEPNRRIVGMTIWETPKLPPEWSSYFQAVDALILPCQWNYDVVLQHGAQVPVGLVPYIYEPPRPTAPMQLEGVRESDFVFYGIGEWTDRKGMHLTLEAYLRAFTAADPVALVLKSGPYNERRRKSGHWWWHVTRKTETIERDVARICRAHPRPARVITFTGRFSDDQMAALHARGNCYVSLTRTEGWGLGAFDAGGRGTPVIMTGYGGQLDFLAPEFAHLVDYSIVPARPTGSVEQDSYGQGHVWAEPDIDHGARLMREVFQNPAAAKARAAQLSRHITGRFAGGRVTETMLGFLNSLEDRH